LEKVIVEGQPGFSNKAASDDDVSMSIVMIIMMGLLRSDRSVLVLAVSRIVQRRAPRGARKSPKNCQSPSFDSSLAKIIIMLRAAGLATAQLFQYTTAAEEQQLTIITHYQQQQQCRRQVLRHGRNVSL
jgi:hypothetical protein